ncbi:hypothetical protein [Aeromicrobium chenweiae]|uniref:hypothetical protein n=1 Tax=Aeromicrobium chenweiae TaxID=2079793 RepID=UPI0010932370|nr:hypothetical protein [Aeromicrobium chenweiae]TGN32085.1 hypothetical protein E4L97_10215 [Aeromicrobium chenweiae]
MRVLVTTGSTAAAATAADVTERSVRRWLADAGFRVAYRAAGRAAASEAVSALLAAQGEAVAALRKALTAESAATRVRAARALLEVGRHVLDEDIEERIERLEEVTRWQQDRDTGLTALPA